MTMLRRMTVVFAVMAALALPATAVLAQDYPLEEGTLQVEGQDDGGSGDEPVLQPGEEITVSGGGFAPGVTVTVAIQSDPVQLARTEADAEGDISVTVAIPASFPAGEHPITATGDDPDGGTLTLRQEVTVTGNDESSLAYTGMNVATLLPVAGLLLVAGAGVLTVNRRRADRSV